MHILCSYLHTGLWLCNRFQVLVQDFCTVPRFCNQCDFYKGEVNDVLLLCNHFLLSLQAIAHCILTGQWLALLLRTSLHLTVFVQVFAIVVQAFANTPRFCNCLHFLFLYSNAAPTFCNHLDVWSYSLLVVYILLNHKDFSKSPCTLQSACASIWTYGQEFKLCTPLVRPFTLAVQLIPDWTMTVHLFSLPEPLLAHDIRLVYLLSILMPLFPCRVLRELCFLLLMPLFRSDVLKLYLVEKLCRLVRTWIILLVGKTSVLHRVEFCLFIFRLLMELNLCYVFSF